MNDKSLSGIIVGSGRAGTYLQRGAFEAAGAKILAYVDIDEKRAAQAAAELNVPYSFSSLDKALDQLKIDFVSICTPAQSHFSQAKTALDAGCHVLIEKPVTETYEEALKLQHLAEQSDQTVCVVHNHKFYPGIQSALNMVNSGQIGKVLHIDRKMTFIESKVRMMELGHWAHNIPGGRLFEANPHNLYLTYAFVGEMKLESIHPKKLSHQWPHVKIDHFAAMLSTDTATINITMSANLRASKDFPRHGPNYLIITGTDGILFANYQYCTKLEDAYLTKSVLRSARSLKNDALNSIQVRSRNMRSKITPRLTRFNDGASSGHKFFIERFVGYLIGKYSSPPTVWNEILFTEHMNEIMGKKAEELIRTQS